MKFAKSTVRLLVLAIVLACVGLIGLQVRLLLNTADLKRTTFEQNAMAALTDASKALEDQVVMDRVFTVHRVDTNVHTGSTKLFVTKHDPDSAKRVAVSVLMTDLGSIQTTVRGSNIVTKLDRPQKITVEAYDQLGRLDTTLLRNVRVSGEQQLQLSGKKFEHGSFYIRVRTDKEVSTIRMDSAGTSSGFSFSMGDSGKRENIVRRVVESLADPGKIVTARLISPTTLDSLVRDALRQRGMDVAFHAALRIEGNTVCSSDSAGTWPPEAKILEVPVGIRVPFGPRETLAAVFPTMGRYLVTQMWLEIALSVFLIGLIVWMFWLTVRTVVRQKEFAGRLTDFINNMTHEFKTPISTISLAGEALDRGDVRRSAKRLSAYTDVIREENKRMGNQVERILHMASLEEGEVEFRKERVLMHEIIHQAAQKLRMHVEARGGTITTTLLAPEDRVIGDRVHLENVVHNILDNAFKYSPDHPTIIVETSSSDNNLTIQVRDKGVGVSHEHIGRVFEKYYRVPTGNVHDVKGFGIGLSYVRLVVEQHGGTVNLASTPGEGAIVTVRLPATVSEESR